MKNWLKEGVTLLELMVVVLIIAILSTVAVGVYTKEVVRAKYSKARSEIRTLEIAITQYEVDTGQLPPSGSGVNLPPVGVDTAGAASGNGYLQVALRNSLSANLYAPLSNRWRGPYIDWDINRMGDANGTPITQTGTGIAAASIHFLDPFGAPYHYIRASDYTSRGGTELPPSNPFALTETYYNPSTFQIISYGADGLPATPRGTGDDISNFESPEI